MDSQFSRMELGGTGKPNKILEASVPLKLGAYLGDGKASVCYS